MNKEIWQELEKLPFALTWCGVESGFSQRHFLCPQILKRDIWFICFQECFSYFSVLSERFLWRGEGGDPIKRCPMNKEIIDRGQDPEMGWVGLLFIIGMSVVAALVIVMTGGLGGIVL